MELKTLLITQWDRSTAVACAVLGGLLLIFGWVGVSGTPFLAEQAPYIVSGGVGGMFLLGVGATLWISADLRDEWRKLDRIEAALAGGVLRYVDEQTAQELPVQRETADEAEVLAPAPRESVRASRKVARSEEPTLTVRPKRSRTGVGHA